MACAINSLPVPVSPSIRTVESVGATRSTCSSTASRAGLLPMMRSNLRSLYSWLPAPTCCKAPTEDLRVRMDICYSSSLQGGSNILEQDFIVERFCEELGCASPQGLHAHFCVAVCSDENGRNAATLGVELGLQLQPGHTRHADVGDQACSVAL